MRHPDSNSPRRPAGGKLYDICLCVHAEQNAMLTAARFGTALDGAFLYTTVQPCFNCLKELMQVRLCGVVFRREWQARHPDYDWVSSEYERLVDHYRASGNLFARLTQAEQLEAVQPESATRAEGAGAAVAPRRGGWRGSGRGRAHRLEVLIHTTATCG